MILILLYVGILLYVDIHNIGEVMFHFNNLFVVLFIRENLIKYYLLFRMYISHVVGYVLELTLIFKKKFTNNEN